MILLYAKVDNSIRQLLTLSTINVYLQLKKIEKDMVAKAVGLGYTLGPMFSAFTRPLKIRIKQEGIPYALEHLVLLKTINETKDSVAQQDIAEKMCKDKSVIFRIVDILEKDGLLIRQVDPCDRRRNILEVTDAGNLLIKSLLEIEIDMTEKLMQNIPAEEIDIFFKVVRLLKENADAAYGDLLKSCPESK